MIIEMIPREIGESASRQSHTIEPALVEPVRGGLHRQMGDALARQPVERFMQRDRIGRGQRAVGRAIGRDEARRSQRRRAISHLHPDLSRECGNRRFSACPRHRDDGCRLGRIKPRSRPRERCTNIRHLYDKRARQGFVRHALRHDGERASGKCGGRETQTVHMRAGNRKKDEAGLHSAAVRAQTGNLAQARTVGDTIILQ